MWTLSNAIQNARKAFYAASIETPDLDARVLLSCAMGTNINKLFANMSDEMPPHAVELFAAFVERRVAGECVAYITGRKWFRYLELEVNNSVLVPRPETEMLINACLELINSKLSSRNSTESSFKTSVLKEQPLKRGVSQGFSLRNPRASAKLTEFCKRLACYGFFYARALP
jgi:release factor glutamine methyltransferase